MSDKTKNIISYVLSILIVGSTTIGIAVAPQITFTVIGSIALGALTLVVLLYIVIWLKEIIICLFSSHFFQKVYRKYITKHYESREQLLYDRDNEICARCDKDCTVKHPLRTYSRYDAKCNKITDDVFIEEHGLKVDGTYFD